METLENIDDLATLVTLDEPQLLEAIKYRFSADKIYTYIGDILVAVNPYKSIPQYGQEDHKRYRNLSKREEEPPHIYALADSVYQSMQHTGQSQCCVVSGESGAGKTESTKYIVQQISQLCHHDSSDLHERIVMVNPLLEAFGNAQTAINNNSSRFGKYIQLDFDEEGGITGAHISEYLLEKSRVVSLAHGEKNFHIFYYMFAGLPQDVLHANKLEKADEHRIMKPVDGSPVFKTTEDKVHYSEMWENLQALFKTTGFQEEDEQGILATLAAILHLTDIEFIPDEQGQAYSVIIKNEESLVLAAELLMVKGEDLATALLSNITTLQHSAEKLVSMKDMPQANDGRDALAKALYGRMFAWTVRQVNFLLKTDGRRRIISNKTIGILDLAGFENFQNNSFEQLCINVANEQLHHFFNQHIFQWEMEEYRREGIEGKDIKFADNTVLLDMFKKPRVGLFAILDDQLKIPSASDAGFLEQISTTFKGNPAFQRPKGQSLKFVIHHYAGPVIYNVENFLEKNRDTLSSNLMECMKKSESNFVCQMFYAPVDNRGSMIINPKKYEAAPFRKRTSVLLRTPSMSAKSQQGGSRLSRMAKTMTKALPHATVGRKSGSEKTGNTMGFHFMNSLAHLMDKLTAGEPHFIRCIKPNTDKLCEVFHESLVLQQLRYTGVLETVKIRRQGYATRLPFQLFLQRYDVSFRGTGATPDACRLILKQTGMKDYEIGKTKVFLRYWHTEQLQLHMDQVHRKVTKCQARIRGFLARRLFRKMLEQVKREEEEVRQLSAEVAKISDMIYKIQLEHIEFDKERHRKKMEALEKKRIEDEECKRQKEATELKRLADEAERKRLADEAESKRLADDVERIRLADDAERKMQEDAERNKNVNRPSVTPDVVDAPSSLFVSASRQFIWEELSDSLSRFPSLSNQIWAKVFYMEKGELMGKVYLRDWDVIVNNADSQYNGRVIGLKYHEFSNPDMVSDDESKLIKEQITEGVEIARDVEGNILMKNLSDSPLIAKDYISPGATCIAPELIDSFGQIPKWFVKVFDMNKYKYHIAQELHKPQMDIAHLQMLSVVRFSFIKNCVNDFATPCWIFICNFTALELLGDEKVLQELLNMGHTAISPDRKTKLRREWAGLYRARRPSTDSWRSSASSVSDYNPTGPDSSTPPGGTMSARDAPKYGKNNKVIKPKK